MNFGFCKLVVVGASSIEEKIPKLWRLWKIAKVFMLAALGGRGGVLGEEHKIALASLNSMGIILDEGLKDYEGALDCYQRSLTVKWKGLVKTHPDTLATTRNIGVLYHEGIERLREGRGDV